MKTLKQTVTGVKTGDIFYTSWGYEQTNVDFYQVTEIKSNHFVIVKELKQEVLSTGDMQGKTRGLKDQFFNDKEFRVKINLPSWSKEPIFKEPEFKHYNAYLWNGSPKYTSSYY